MSIFDFFKSKPLPPTLCHNDYPIVGVTFNNDDGTSRQEIIKKMSNNDPVKLEVYKYNNEDAISITTKDGKQIGNIKKEHIPYVLDRMKRYEKSKIFDIHSFVNDDNEEIFVAKVIIYYWK